MSDSLPGALGEIWPEWHGSDKRRALAAEKLRIYDEDHKALIESKIDACIDDRRAAGYVKRFVARSPNLLRAVASAVAVATRQGVRRTLKGATPAASAAFAAMVAESGIAKKAAGINARSWVAGPHIIAPHFTRRGKFALDIIGPDICDVRRDGADIDAVIWKHAGSYVVLDHERWRYFDAEGAEIRDDQVWHYVGICPGVPFVSFDGGPDFWASTAHSGLVDATLTIGYKFALGLFNRATHSTPLTTIYTDLEKTPPGQVLGHPMQPLVLPTDAGTKVEVDADRVVKPADYLEEIAAIITSATSAEGLPPGAVTLTASDWAGLSVVADGPVLAAHRDRQVPPLKESELALWPKAADMIRGSTHRLARVMPPGDEIADMLRVTFPDLATNKEQLERIEVLRAGLPFGLFSPDDIILAAQPEISPEEASEMRAEKLARHIADTLPLMIHNMPAEAPEAHGVQTLAQEQGRAGGEASGRTRAAQAAQETNNP